MRVLFATPWLPPGGGGLERYADSLARRLALEGHDITILGHAPEAIEDASGGVRRIGVVPRWRVSNTPFSLGVFRKAREILRALPHALVNVHTPVPGTAELVALAARRARVPHVVTYHAGALEAPPGLVRALARLHARVGERWMLRRAAARIAVSPFVAHGVLRGFDPIVVPPGVDTKLFREVANPVPGRIVFVGPVSRAYAWKGLSVLVEAFARLRSDEAHLRIVGDGDLAEHYRQMMPGRPVTVVGRVSEDQLVREYSRASVVVLPSITPAESFGMVLAEANACGRPVIGSAVGGIPGFVRDQENGTLVPPGDARALAAAIERILGDPLLARSMGEAGRARVENEHSWESIAAATARVYGRVARSA